MWNDFKVGIKIKNFIKNIKISFAGGGFYDKKEK